MPAPRGLFSSAEGFFRLGFWQKWTTGIVKRAIFNLGVQCRKWGKWETAYFLFISLIKPNSEASQTLLSSRSSRINIMIRGFGQTAAGRRTNVWVTDIYLYFLSFVCFVAKRLTAHCLIIRTLLLFKILMIASVTMAHQLNWNKVSLGIYFFEQINVKTALERQAHSSSWTINVKPSKWL